MRLYVCALLLIAATPFLWASRVQIEIDDAILRLRLLHYGSLHTVYLLHNIYLAPAAADSPTSHIFSAAFTAPFGRGVIGALRIEGASNLLHDPLAHSAQSTQHYRTGVTRAHTAIGQRSNRNGVALSYTGDLDLHLIGYVKNDLLLHAFFGVAIPVGDAVIIEQWNALSLISELPVADWWFDDRLYFLDTHLYVHAMKVHLRLDVLSAACSALIQHAQFHIPQYALTCALQWNSTYHRLSGFTGIQSEYYADAEGQVLDEWIVTRLHYSHDLIADMRLAIAGETILYKPDRYYRIMTFAAAVPAVALEVQWNGESIVDASSAVAIGYGLSGDVRYDSRADAAYRIRGRVALQGELITDPLLWSVRARFQHAEPYQQELALSSDMRFTVDAFAADVSVDYAFDISQQSHERLDVGVKLSYTFPHTEIYAAVLIDVLDTIGIEDISYRIGANLSL